ncbi:MAG: FeS assembly protein SufD [Frankiales bacterium]|nr:FeS assembly protein SufD [Frankiales bacterium]
MTAIDTNNQQAPHSHGLPVAGSTGSGSPPERFTSRNPDDFAVPTGREEEWRFTPLRKLRPMFNSFQVDSTIRPTWVAPAEVTIEVVAADDALIGSVLRPADRVSALALANVRHALVVRIPAGIELSEPVWVTITGKPGLNYGHVVIDAAPNSKATVILDHVGSASLAANVETIVGDGANLTVVSVQDWDADTIHLAALATRVNRDAKLTHVVINLGGSIVRLTPTVEFGGPGAQAELYGLSFAGDGQHQESRLHVDHAVPNCSSNVVYKSALDGETARTVWIGDVRIRPAATGTSTYELNRNLLLSDGARADSVPNLEIETGEIAGAGHASATGRFDDLQLFYLQSRGIPEEDARRLVVRGFFNDILKYIKVEALHDRLMDTILTRLGAK